MIVIGKSVKNKLKNGIVLISMILLACHTIGASISSKSKLAEIENLDNGLLSILFNINAANIAVRQAALAPNKTLIDIELKVLATTRPSTSAVYEVLKSARVWTNEDKAVVKMLILERKDYIYWQKQVVEDIRFELCSKQQLWQHLKVYEYTKDRYIARLNGLRLSLDRHETRIRIKMLITIFITIVLSTLYLLACTIRLFFDRNEDSK